MGWKYEVNAWRGDGLNYEYFKVYTGDSLFRAIVAMWRAKRTSGCVKLEWR